jgi:predicted  nucleic acid-binding Zn-ribbon protein
MESEKQISGEPEPMQALRHNVQDLETLLAIREEELEEWRAKTGTIASLYSRIETQLLAMEQMQLRIGEEMQEKQGALRREAALENELIQGIETEKAYYALQTAVEHLSAELKHVQDQLNELTEAIRSTASLKKRVAELESELDIQRMENYFLKNPETE